MGGVISFRELRAYRGAFRAAMAVYHGSRAWPEAEHLSLTRLIRRSSRSVCGDIAEAWRKRACPQAFVSKLEDAEAEAAETRVWLDFALACQYLERDEYLSLDRDYARVLVQLGGMRDTDAP